MEAQFWINLLNWVDQHGNAILVFVTLVGWIIILKLDQENLRYEKKLALDFKLYDEFMSKAAVLSEKQSALNIKLGYFPFYQVQNVLKGETQAMKEFHEYMGALLKQRSEFIKASLDYLHLFEVWSHLGAKLEKPHQVIFDEFKGLAELLDGHYKKLQAIYIDKSIPYNKEELEKHTFAIADKIIEFYVHVEDMNKLLYSNLVGKVYRNEPKRRETLKPEYKILTMKGLEENLSRDPKEYQKYGLEMPKKKEKHEK